MTYKAAFVVAFQMATMMKIVLLVLSVGCVASQRTTDENDIPLYQQSQLQLQIDKLEQHQQQIAQVLHRLIDQHRQQFDKLNELRTILTDGLGKLGTPTGNAEDRPTCAPRNLTARDVCDARESAGEFSVFTYFNTKYFIDNMDIK